MCGAVAVQRKSKSLRMQATQVDIDMLFLAIAETSPSMFLWQWHRDGFGMCGNAAEGKAKVQVEWDAWFVMLAHASQLIVTMFFCSNIGCLV